MIRDEYVRLNQEADGKFTERYLFAIIDNKLCISEPTKLSELSWLTEFTDIDDNWVIKECIRGYATKNCIHIYKGYDFRIEQRDIYDIQNYLPELLNKTATHGNILGGIQEPYNLLNPKPLVVIGSTDK